VIVLPASDNQEKNIVTRKNNPMRTESGHDGYPAT